MTENMQNDEVRIGYMPDKDLYQIKANLNKDDGNYLMSTLLGHYAESKYSPVQVTEYSMKNQTCVFHDEYDGDGDAPADVLGDAFATIKECERNIKLEHKPGYHFKYRLTPNARITMQHAGNYRELQKEIKQDYDQASSEAQHAFAEKHPEAAAEQAQGIAKNAPKVAGNMPKHIAARKEDALPADAVQLGYMPDMHLYQIKLGKDVNKLDLIERFKDRLGAALNRVTANSKIGGESYNGLSGERNFVFENDTDKPEKVLGDTISWTRRQLNMEDDHLVTIGKKPNDFKIVYTPNAYKVAKQAGLIAQPAPGLDYNKKLISQPDAKAQPSVSRLKLAPHTFQLGYNPKSSQYQVRIGSNDAEPHQNPDAKALDQYFNIVEKRQAQGKQHMDLYDPSNGRLVLTMHDNHRISHQVQDIMSDLMSATKGMKQNFYIKQTSNLKAAVKKSKELPKPDMSSLSDGNQMSGPDITD